MAAPVLVQCAWVLSGERGDLLDAVRVLVALVNDSPKEASRQVRNPVLDEYSETFSGNPGPETTTKSAGSAGSATLVSDGPAATASR